LLIYNYSGIFIWGTMEKLKQLVSRLTGRVIISSEVSEADLADIEIEPLIGHIITYFDGKPIGILDKATLNKIIEEMNSEKKPVEIEVNRVADFKSQCKGIRC